MFKKFIEILNERNIKFIQKENKIIINDDGYVVLDSLTSLPEGISFNNNSGNIYLNSLTSLPEDISFNNNGNIYLNSLTSLSKDTIFKNVGSIYLRSLTSLSENITFNNSWNIYFDSLSSLHKNITFNNGRDIHLSSLESLPEDIIFNNGGYVHLETKEIRNNKDYITRFNINVENDFIILYKRVSYDFKTQENTKNETVWKIGDKVIHPNWQPEFGECGPGKFHACAYPHWCDIFRNKKGDRYIAIKVSINNLHEWKDNPSFPQKIGFREGIVLYECDRNANPF